MNPTFLFAMAFMLWVALAVAVWIIAAFLALFPSKRRMGLCLASAMAGTFPGVIAYQVIATPIILILLLFIRLFWKAIEPGTATTTQNPAVIVASIIAALLAFALIAGMSLTGFWEGWRAGWVIARGESITSTLRSGPMARSIHVFTKHVLRRRVNQEMEDR